jgi:hypothetical protein
MKLIPTTLTLAYAQIDLRYATIKIKDGGDNTQKCQAVTPTAILIAAAPAATSITVASWSPVVVPATGETAYVYDNLGVIKQVFTITGGSATTITFTAGTLKVAITATDVIRIFPAAQSIDVRLGSGTLTWSEKRNMVYTMDRGNLYGVREGDEVPMDVKLEFMWESIKGTGSVPSIEDALKRQGAAAAWVSVDTDACNPYAVNMVVDYIPNCPGTVARELITLEDFRWESLDHDLKAGTVSISGKCNTKQANILRMIV